LQPRQGSTRLRSIFDNKKLGLAERANRDERSSLLQFTIDYCGYKFFDIGLKGVTFIVEYEGNFTLGFIEILKSSNNLFYKTITIVSDNRK
jgi:hypothetical protein